MCLTRNPAYLNPEAVQFDGPIYRYKVVLKINETTFESVYFKRFFNWKLGKWKSKWFVGKDHNNAYHVFVSEGDAEHFLRIYKFYYPEDKPILVKVEVKGFVAGGLDSLKRKTETWKKCKIIQCVY